MTSFSEVYEITVGNEPWSFLRSSSLSCCISVRRFRSGVLTAHWVQIYALLYVLPEPLCAYAIVEALGISRSSSMRLRELQTWNLVLLMYKSDDRHYFFTTLSHVCLILSTLAEERGKLETDPTLLVLRDVLRQPPRNDAERFAQQHIAEIHSLSQQLTCWYDAAEWVETERLITLLSLDTRVTKLLETRDKVIFLGRGRRLAGKR